MQRVFEKWDKILSWYEEETGDFPYWYLERTNIGHLGLAVYELSGIPLQEFSCTKGRRGAKKSVGRADLYISVPNKGGKSIDVNIEAKQAWCSIQFSKRSKPVLRKALDAAISDCRHLKDKAWEARFCAAIVFLLPYANAMPKDNAEMARQLRAFTQSVSDECACIGVDFVAFHYPATKILKRISRKNAQYGWCPGIAVVGKLVP